MTKTSNLSRLSKPFAVCAAVLAIAWAGVCPAVAAEKGSRPASADARQRELAALVAAKQAAAQKALAASKKLTRQADPRPTEPKRVATEPAIDEDEVVLASARIPGSQELLRPAGRAAAQRARTIRMEVTAYCPCKKCCGSAAQGITASGKRVSHNNGRFVAADTDVLPFGKKLVIPGYHGGTPVEVLDTGSAIKGKRLDVYFPSHQTALEWGRRTIDVTVVE